MKNKKMYKAKTISRNTTYADSCGTIAFENDMIKNNVSGLVFLIKYGRHSQWHLSSEPQMDVEGFYTVSVFDNYNSTAIEVLPICEILKNSTVIGNAFDNHNLLMKLKSDKNAADNYYCGLFINY